MISDAVKVDLEIGFAQMVLGKGSIRIIELVHMFFLYSVVR